MPHLSRLCRRAPSLYLSCSLRSWLEQSCADLVQLATYAATLYRCSALLTPGALGLALLHCTLCMACAWWRNSVRPSCPRWSEAANALLRASSQLLLPLLTHHAVESLIAPPARTHTGLPAPGLVPLAALPWNALLHAARAAVAAAQHAALLLWASGAPAALGCVLGWRMRFGASAFFQLCLSAAFMRSAPKACMAPALSSLPAQHRTHDLYALVGLPSLALLGPSTARPSALGECVSLLRFLQLALALVLPLAWQLAAEAAAGRRQALHIAPARPAHRPTHSVRSACPVGDAGDDWLPMLSAIAIGAALAWECTAIASAHG
ncbi:hypothetical protein ABPG77_010608 [Micractinium sp. CCAP 211/92]